MINVRKALAKGGVPELVRQCGMRPEALKGYGDTLEQVWANLDHPGVLTTLAIHTGVPQLTVVQAAHLAVSRLVAETGTEPKAVAQDCLKAVETVLAEPGEQPRFRMQELVEALKAAALWLATAKDRGESAATWDALIVAASVALGQAAWAATCTCGHEHLQELERSVDGAMASCCAARLMNATSTGRIPKGTPDEAAFCWAANSSAGHVREVLPLELVTAPKMVTIPGVTLDGNLVWNKRERGQA